MSQIDFGDSNFEANPYAGVSLGLFENWRIDAALAGYLYDGKVYGRQSDYGELYALLHFRDLATVRLGNSFDAYGSGRSIMDYAAHTRFPLTDTVEVSGEVGYQAANTVLKYNYLYWNLGATWFLHRHASIDLRYYAVRHLAESKGAIAGFALPAIDHPLVFSISIGF